MRRVRGREDLWRSPGRKTAGLSTNRPIFFIVFRVLRLFCAYKFRRFYRVSPNNLQRRTDVSRAVIGMSVIPRARRGGLISSGVWWAHYYSSGRSISFTACTSYIHSVPYTFFPFSRPYSARLCRILCKTGRPVLAEPPE